MSNIGPMGVDLDRVSDNERWYYELESREPMHITKTMWGLHLVRGEIADRRPLNDKRLEGNSEEAKRQREINAKLLFILDEAQRNLSQIIEEEALLKGV